MEARFARMKMACTAFLLAVDIWCYLRHPVIMSHAVLRAKSLLKPARPTTITEKFLWRKLFDRNPLFTLACDKLRAKTYALGLCPELKTASVLWAGSDPDMIPDTMLNRSAVLKANHGSGWNVLDLDNYNSAELRHKARQWMKQKHYGWNKGEWAYRDVPKSIFLEQSLCVNGGLVQSEYKFHVACGTTAYVFVKLMNVNAATMKLVLDRDGAVFMIDEDGVRHRPDMKPPPRFLKMREIAEHLSKEFDFVRCDLYDMPDGIYFSELTVYPSSGHGNIGHQHLIDLRNSLWDIRQSWFFTTPRRGWAKWYASALLDWLDQNDKARSERFDGRARLNQKTSR